MKKIRYLITLAKLGHFGRAAEACHVSQPTLSSAIQHLEEELGITLIQRGHHFMGLTPAGEKILIHAQRLEMEWESLKQEASLCQQQLTGTLHIGAIPTTLAVVPLLTESYYERYPNIKCQLLSYSAEHIMRGLDNFELDLGLTYLGDARLQGFNVLPLYKEQHVLVARHTEIGELGEILNWKQVAELPLCLLTPDMQNRQIIDGAFRDAGVKPNVVMETDSIFALYAQVRCAGLFSIVPHSLLSLIEMRQEIIAIPLQPILTREIGLIARQKEIETPIQQAAWQISKQLNLQSRFDALIDIIY